MNKFQQELVRDLRDAVWDRNEEISRMKEEMRHIESTPKNQLSIHEELKNQAEEIAKLKMQTDGGNNLLIIWISSVVLAMYCTWLFCSN